MPCTCTNVACTQQYIGDLMKSYMRGSTATVRTPEVHYCACQRARTAPLKHGRRGGETCRRTYTRQLTAASSWQSYRPPSTRHRYQHSAPYNDRPVMSINVLMLFWLVTRLSVCLSVVALTIVIWQPCMPVNNNRSPTEMSRLCA